MEDVEMSLFQAVKMTYALSKEDEFVSVKNVANGLACECVCIDCQGRLSAKQGKVKQWHFAHHQESDKDNCQWSGESEIHLRVKKYLEQYRVLTVPIGYSKPTTLSLKFDDIRLEKSLRPTKRIPDVTGYCNGERILVEVKVTHEVDKQKTAEYKAVNASVIEIDFSDFSLVEDRILDEHIESHLGRADLNWLSVAPVGVIAEQFQAHERAITKAFIVENKRLALEQEILEKEIKGKQDYIQSFSRQYDEYKYRIKCVTDELVSISRQAERFKNERDRNVEAANTSFMSTLYQLEEQYLRRLDSENAEKLKLIEREYLTELHDKHHLLQKDIMAVEAKLLCKKEELRAVENQAVNLDEKAVELCELQIKVQREAKALREKEQAWSKATMANTSIKKHFVRMEPDLRQICRKGGVPWPFNGSLLDELSPDSID
ncbi:hypothetical protein Shal_4058 [Shewanella halifaxensis HAW-EB4]|uniref:Competence protein CoiA-like N-terminal domain-containing protein n=1 Tax=Shewanella halifaxensis (strain HAW-EB4) TaxID=458817 RepID=B0TKL2_SHEHH|nr:competence protein CoiA family protein [Shewanella halifaxensis]ABZ78598.1 hypothetical protein Shal_4058 [Shewanella halifaxensis HAW-EB4]